MKLKIAIVCFVIAVGLVIAAYSVSWYKIKVTYPNNIINKAEDDFYFYWEDWTHVTNGQTTTYNYTSNSIFGVQLPNVKNTFQSVLGFIIVAGCLLVASAVWNILRLWMKCLKNSFGKFIAIGAAVAAVVFLAISFFTFLQIPSSFLKDQFPPCKVGLLGSNYDSRNCHSILGSDQSSTFGFNSDYNYSPDAGWWLNLAAIVVAGFGLGHVLASHRD